MNTPTHWKIFTTVPISRDEYEKISAYFWWNAKFKLAPNALICYDLAELSYDPIDAIKTYLQNDGYDVITIQPDIGAF